MTDEKPPEQTGGFFLEEITSRRYPVGIRGKNTNFAPIFVAMKTQLPSGKIYLHLSELITPQAAHHENYQPIGTVLVTEVATTPHPGDTATILLTKSLITGHSLRSTPGLEPQVRREGPADWIFFVLFTSLSLIALIRMVYAKKLHTLVLAPFSARRMSQVIRDTDMLTPALKFYLQVNYLAMTSLAAYLVVEQFTTLPDQIYTKGFFLYSILFLLLSIFYALRIRLATFWGHLFKENEMGYKYKLNHHLMSILLGLVLIPILASIVYFPPEWLTISLIIGVILTGTFISIRLLKTIILGFTFRWYALVYIFLYLCTLEILPVLLLIKTIAKLYTA